MSDGKALYFPGLNGIRAIAASAVVIAHTLVWMDRFPGHERGPWIDLGDEAVEVFFSLSGFLITLLLLREKEQLGQIKLGQFYLRRILRIWPLYFFYIAIAAVYHLVADGGLANASGILLLVLFLPNVAKYKNLYPPDTPQLWSIGIEEQFYAFWPLAVRTFRRLQPFLIGLVVVVFAIRLGIRVKTGSVNGFWFRMTRGYDAMAIGALVAIYYHQGATLLRSLARSWLPDVLFATFLVLAASNHYHQTGKLGELWTAVFGGAMTAAITALFIVSQIEAATKPTTLERQPLIYLGRISFGLYVYHPLVITACAGALHAVLPDSVLPTAALVTIVYAATVLIAAVSFRFLEGPFLRLKSRFTSIQTTS